MSARVSSSMGKQCRVTQESRYRIIHPSITLTESLQPAMTPNLSDTVHFVGSVCLPDQPTVLQRLSSSLPSRLRRIPDGETGKRQNFVAFQRDIFNDIPLVKAPVPQGIASKAPKLAPDDSSQIQLLPIEYDDFAIAGYDHFCKLRTEGVIPEGVRFQVSLPTPINVVGILVEPSWRARVEPYYEQALLAALKHIQDHIPAADLAIQWDLASEFAFLEGAASFPAWFSPLKDGLIDRVLKVAAAVHKDVALGFHLCYGDMGHKHFVQPKDTALLVEIGNAIVKGITRPVDWLHMPVPKSRVDADYFSPLKQLDIGDTELYLGLLHADDEEGSRERIKAAAKVIAPFGLATECGLGRSSQAELDSILEIASRLKGHDE